MCVYGKSKTMYDTGYILSNLLKFSPNHPFYNR